MLSTPCINPCTHRFRGTISAIRTESGTTFQVAHCPLLLSTPPSALCRSLSFHVGCAYKAAHNSWPSFSAPFRYERLRMGKRLCARYILWFSTFSNARKDRIDLSIILNIRVLVKEAFCISACLTQENVFFPDIFFGRLTTGIWIPLYFWTTCTCISWLLQRKILRSLDSK